MKKISFVTLTSGIDIIKLFFFTMEFRQNKLECLCPASSNIFSQVQKPTPRDIKTEDSGLSRKY